MSNKILFAFILILVSSCVKQSIVPYNNILNDSEKKIQALLNLPDALSQRMAFSLFTSEQKALFWNKHISNSVNNNNFNEEQLELINEMSSKITARLYSDKKYAAIFKVTDIDPWLQKATKVFSNTDIFQLAFNYRNNLIQYNTPKNNFQHSNCDCEVGSNFTCYKIVSWPPKITYGNCSATRQTCIITESGCGFLASSDCDGNHCDNDVQN